MRIYIGATYLKIDWASAIKIEHVQNLWPSNHTPKYILEINVVTCSPGDTHKRVPESALSGNKILETSIMATRNNGHTGCGMLIQ